MSKAHHYREQAAECERRAMETTSGGDRAQLLQIASAYLRSAEQEEERENGVVREPIATRSSRVSPRS